VSLGLFGEYTGVYRFLFEYVDLFEEYTGLFLSVNRAFPTVCRSLLKYFQIFLCVYVPLESI